MSKSAISAEFVPDADAPFEFLMVELRRAESEGLSFADILALLENKLSAADAHEVLCDLVTHGFATVESPYNRDERWYYINN